MSGREPIQPGTALYTRVAHLLEGPGPHYFQNFEGGMLLETKAGGPGEKSKFSWVDPLGNVIVRDHRVDHVDMGRIPLFDISPPKDAGSAALQQYWSDWVRKNISPLLNELGVTTELIERVIRWGISEGIYNISNNRSYGHTDGTRQSPLSFTNFFDSHRHPEYTKNTNVNALTSAPNPYDWVSKFGSGDWQVGIGGIQVSDAIPGALRRAFGLLYPNDNPASVGQRILELMGEPGAVFPKLTLEELFEPKNAKWAAVLLHDPALNILIQSWNPNLP